MGETLQEIKERLKRLDSQTLNRRAERLAELEPIALHERKRRSGLMCDFIGEASKAYGTGCFRSCIFSCSGAVEHALRHELTCLLGGSVNELKKVKDMSFNGVIKEVGKYKKFQPFTEDAHYLRRLRNKIAAHPLQPPLTELRTQKEIEIERESAIRDLKTFMKFLDSGSVELKEAEEIFRGLKTLEEAIGWRIYALDLLQRLALEAWRRMRATINGLYPIRDT